MAGFAAAAGLAGALAAAGFAAAAGLAAGLAAVVVVFGFVIIEDLLTKAMIH
jgi:hypothetical protein